VKDQGEHIPSILNQIEDAAVPTGE
jgi:hypothetical protein